MATLPNCASCPTATAQRRARRRRRSGLSGREQCVPQHGQREIPNLRFLEAARGDLTMDGPGAEADFDFGAELAALRAVDARSARWQVVGLVRESTTVRGFGNDAGALSRHDRKGLEEIVCEAKGRWALRRLGRPSRRTAQALRPDRTGRRNQRHRGESFAPANHHGLPEDPGPFWKPRIPPDGAPLGRCPGNHHRRRRAGDNKKGGADAFLLGRPRISGLNGHRLVERGGQGGATGARHRRSVARRGRCLPTSGQDFQLIGDLVDGGLARGSTLKCVITTVTRAAPSRIAVDRIAGLIGQIDGRCDLG